MIPTAANNDNDLLLKVANGDEKAFEYLYTKHIEFLYGFILKYVKSPSLAEDLAQDTFIRIWENRKASLFLSIGIPTNRNGRRSLYYSYTFSPLDASTKRNHSNLHFCIAIDK